jgi:hypothetical protein
MEMLFDLGPFGFRGPAAAHMPAHLTSVDGGLRTTQLIAPGHNCSSNVMLEDAIGRLQTGYLYVTSANLSRHRTGAEDEPAHFAAEALAAEFAGEVDFHLIRHRDEAAVRRAYSRHEPMSTTVLAFHKRRDAGASARPTLVLERHGSLHVDTLRPILDSAGFDMSISPKGARRLLRREY